MLPLSVLDTFCEGIRFYRLSLLIPVITVIRRNNIIDIRIVLNIFNTDNILGRHTHGLNNSTMNCLLMNQFPLHSVESLRPGNFRMTHNRICQKQNQEYKADPCTLHLFKPPHHPPIPDTPTLLSSLKHRFLPVYLLHKPVSQQLL